MYNFTQLWLCQFRERDGWLVEFFMAYQNWREREREIIFIIVDHIIN